MHHNNKRAPNADAVFHLNKATLRRFTCLPYLCGAFKYHQSGQSLSCAACCDRICLLSTRKFVWVLLGPGLVTPGPKQIQPAAGFLLHFFFFSRQRE